MTLTAYKAWMESWFDPSDPQMRELRHGQLMQVMTTGSSALATSIATIVFVAAIAAQWHDLTWVLAFAISGTVLSVAAHLTFLRAAALAESPDNYRAANIAYMWHSFFVVAAMAVVGLIWIPGDLAPNTFTLLVLVICATVRVAHQSAHLPSAALSAIYFIAGIALCLSEGTVLYLSMAALGVSVALMLAELAWRMNKTVESMLKLGQSERALIAVQQRLVGELRDANHAKSQFLARMSHELRTPLNAVIGFSDVMLRQSLGPVGAPGYLDYLGHINASGTHLLRLINDILDLSKLEAGRFQLREDDVDPCDAVEDACAMVRLRAEEGGVRLINDLPRGQLLRADELALRQIAINLVSNAVKFTPPGGAVRWSSCLTPDGAFSLSIEDNGCGIPAKDLDEVFEPFGQSASAAHAKERGTGLGLPIVRSLMTLHGGTAAIASRVGEGTTVTLVFPANRVLGQAARAAA